MRLYYSPNPQCVLVSFAMALKANPDHLIEKLGRNGLAKINDDPEPWCYESFHPQEFVRYLLKEHGVRVVLIEAQPRELRYGEKVREVAPCDLREFLAYGDGVLFGRTPDGVGHACAWSERDNKIFDPRGRIYEWEERLDQGFDPDYFFLVGSTT